MNTDEQQPAIIDIKKFLESTRLYQHDPFFRSTFEEPEMFRKLLEWHLSSAMLKLLDLDRMECQKDSLLDEQLKAYYTDLLYKIPIRGTDENIVVFILVEHKTSPARWTMFQILQYIVQVWQREFNAAKEQGRLADFLLPPILPIIVYHGERKFTAPIRFGNLIRLIGDFAKYTPDFEGMLLDLMVIREDQLPDDLELHCVLAVMQAVFRKDIADRMLKVYQKLRPKFHDKRYHERWTRLYFYMLSSSKYLNPNDLEEVKNQMSDTDTDVITIPPWLEASLMKSYREGEAIGIEQGIGQGIETLLRILTKNFGEVPHAIREKLHTIHDFKVLGQLTDVALDCKTLDEFEKALSR